MAPNKGEFLCKKRVELWIRDDTYVDNARPEFMTNPTSNEPMECDRIHLVLSRRVPRLAALRTNQDVQQEREPGATSQRPHEGALCEKNGYTLSRSARTI